MIDSMLLLETSEFLNMSLPTWICLMVLEVLTSHFMAFHGLKRLGLGLSGAGEAAGSEGRLHEKLWGSSVLGRGSAIHGLAMDLHGL